MAKYWLFANILTIIVLAFYSMLEMAIVSFNKVRLQYFVNQGSKKAERINNLLHHPARLFGTTLIGVNVATVVGSECAREFHLALGIDPNFAPLSQVFLVIIFGELAPMFAARNYPEHVSMLGINLIYLSSKILAPVVWLLEKISKFVLLLLGNKNHTTSVFLSQDELVRILEEQDEDHPYESDDDEATIIPSNIFLLNKKNIEMVMTPLNKIAMLPSDVIVTQMRNFLLHRPEDYILLYNKQPKNVVYISQPRDLLRASPTKRVKEFSKSPWFIIKTSSLGEILKQFRTNKEKIAVVLNERGEAIGVVTRDDLLREIFGKIEIKEKNIDKETKTVIIQEITLQGYMFIENFNKKFNTTLNYNPKSTLSDLIVDILGHPPEVGDQITINNFEMTVQEITLFGVKTLTVSTVH